MLVYIGTYSQRGSKGIYAYRFDPVTGALAPAGWAGGDVTNPSFLALHPNRKFLYAVAETGGKGKEGGVAAFTVTHDATGKLVPLDVQPSGGAGPCFVVVDPTGRDALIANYGGGTVAVLPIKPDGKLLPPSSRIVHSGPSHVVPDRQEAPHAHTIHVDPSGRYALACDLGLDKILVYRFDSAHGLLKPNNPPFAATKPGAGPRQLAFHPTHPWAYSANELSCTVDVWRWDAGKGTLTNVQNLSSLPDGWLNPGAGHKNTDAEIQVHPSGKWVYASNRGHDSIVSFAVDPSSGQLKTLDWVPSGGKTPRHFGIDPSGRWLIAAHQDGDSLVVFRIDERTGALTPTGVRVDVPAPVCVVFAPEA